ncbi:MAG: hypothetical protein ACI8SJ_002552, partial [Shewanella sp.]
HTDLLVILLKSVIPIFQVSPKTLGRWLEEAYSTLSSVSVKCLF